MSQKNGKNDSNGHSGNDQSGVWPHPRNPRIRVTDNHDYFVKLIQADAFDGVILVRSDELRKEVGEKMKLAFRELHYESRPPNALTAQVAYDAKSNFLDVQGTLPPQLQRVQKEIETLLLTFSHSVTPKSALYIVEDAQNFFPSKGRVVPVMMTHWVTAGRGAMTRDQNLLLQPGHIGYFTPDVDMPLHNYNSENASVTFAVIRQP